MPLPRRKPMPRSSRFTFVSLLVLILAAAAVPVRAEDGAADLAAALQAGQKHLAFGEPGLAVDSFRLAVRLSGDTSFPAALGLADALSQVKRYAEAIEGARHAQSLATTPEERGDASGLLGMTLLAQGDAAGAAPVLQELAAASGPYQKNARQ